MDAPTPPVSASQWADPRKYAATASVLPTHADGGALLRLITSWGELRTLPIDEKWYSLGLQLGINSTKLDAIQQSHPSNLFKCKVEMLKVWLHEDQTASWRQLINALNCINEGSLANELLSLYNVENLENCGTKSREHAYSHHDRHSSMREHFATEVEETDGVPLQYSDSGKGSSVSSRRSSTEFALAMKEPLNPILQAIRENHHLLLALLPGMEIVPQLYSKALISRTDYENILSKRTTHECNMVLLDSIQRVANHSPDSFEQFLQVLSEHPSCSQIPEILRKSIAENKEHSSVLHTQTKTEEVWKDGGNPRSRSSGELTPISSGLMIDGSIPPDPTSLNRSSSSAESFHSAAGDDESQFSRYQIPGEVATLPRATHEVVVPRSLKKDDSEHSDSGKGSSVNSRRNSTEITQTYLDAVLIGSGDTVSELLSDNKVIVDVPLREQIWNAAYLIITDTMTALMIAASDGHSVVVRILLEFHASVNLTDKDGCTPLYLAASRGNYEPVKQLVSASSDVNATAKDGSPVLLWPAAKGFSVIVQFLLENAANPNIANNLGHTPLIAAASRNHKDVVEVLLEYKADVSATTYDTSKTALQEAIDHNYTEIIAILTKASVTAGRKSQAMFSCKTAERVQQLLKEGVKVNDKRGDGSTPLIAHAEEGNLSVVVELLSAGADVDEKDQSQMSALMKASKQGFSKIVQELVTAQAILDLKSQSGKTALMYAAQNKHTAVTECLVKAGANISLKDKSGKTALEIASEVKCPDIVKLLKDQTAIAADSQDPFVRALSTYFEKFSKQQAENKLAAASKPRDQEEWKISRKTPKDSETSTFKDQLQKAWKRIADLETRVHDLTLQSTMELPLDADLSYFDRGRLEAEYLKMKGLKKKFEQYAIDAKQTAQRLSAENFKLKEDQMREKHAHEIRHKTLLSEMEEKFDRAAIASTVRQDQAEVFEREVSAKARELVRLNPTRVYLTPQTSCSPEDIKDLILTHTVRASILQVGVGGLPRSGKSTLVKSLLNLKESEDYTRKGFDDGLSMYEAVRMTDAVAELCEWIPARKEDAIFISVAAALAQVCLQKNINPNIPDIHALLKLFNDPQIDAHFSEVLKGVAKVMKLIEEHKVSSAVLSRASITYINLMDVGHNKALYEVLAIFASDMKNFLLLDVLDLERDAGTLYQRHSLMDKSVYPTYRTRANDKLFRLRSTLAYYILFMFTAKKTTVATKYPSVLLVGTHADCLDGASCKKARKNVLVGVKARPNDFGLSDVIYPGIAAVDARNPENVTEVVRKALDKLIDENHRFERDIRLSWVFLRTVLYSIKKMFMPKCELMPYAKKCGLIDENELEEFLQLFKDVGSILYSSTSECRVLHENVVLDPVSFICGMDKLYYAEVKFECDDIPENLKPDYQLLSQGFLTINFAHHLWSNDCTDFYLQTLEAIRVIAHVPFPDCLKLPGIQSGSKIYFMPTLRPNFYSEKPSQKCNSLIIRGESFHQGHLIVHRLSEFLLYLLQHYQNYVSFERNTEYNVMHFHWCSPNLQADVFVRFIVVYAEIEIKPCTTYELEDYDFLCSVLKTASIEIFGRSNEYYHLGFICPHSDGKEYPDGLHFLPFHPLAQERDRLYCHQKCGKFISLNEEQKRWISAPYRGPQDCLPGDCLSVSMADEIAQELSDLTEREVRTLAGALGFTKVEVEYKLATRSSMCDTLLTLLLKFRQRKPATARKSLAEALLKCEHYTMALKLHPKFLTGSTPILHPLTTKEFAVISQYIQDWQTLAKLLQVSPDEIERIKNEHKSTAEQCCQMLRSWERNYSPRQATTAASGLKPEPDSNAFLSQSPQSSISSTSGYSSESNLSIATPEGAASPYSEQSEVDPRSTLIHALRNSEIHGQKLASYLETGHADMLLK